MIYAGLDVVEIEYLLVLKFVLLVVDIGHHLYMLMISWNITFEQIMQYFETGIEGNICIAMTYSNLRSQGPIFPYEKDQLCLQDATTLPIYGVTRTIP